MSTDAGGALERLGLGDETLAIVAYKQPITRAGIEAIRGVACGEVLRSLMEHNLVKIVGRAEEIGRPMLYGTTRYFLEVFGLANLKDLPKAEEALREAMANPKAGSKVRQNLGLVVGLQGRFAEAEQIVKADLPPDEAAANVAYLREMLKGNKDNSRPSGRGARNVPVAELDR